jgi:hypothetical protein
MEMRDYRGVPPICVIRVQKPLHDTRLSRHSPIKVSKDQFSERFEREVRAVGALNRSTT